MVSVIIPTLNASAFLPDLLTRLNNQTVKDLEIIIIDSSSTDNTVEIAKQFKASTITIPRNEFNHGTTRNMGAHEAKHDILAYLTQDVTLLDNNYLENLIRPLHTADIAASYGKQIPQSNAIPPEQFARLFNYPDTPLIKTKRDIPTLGIKTFFFTNVCSAIRKKEFFEAGGFPEQVIMNEDIIFAAKLIMKGYNIAYVPDAKVIHSHNYSLIQQFKRYFDIGVAFNRKRWFLELAKAEGEGLHYIKNHLGYLWSKKKIHWILYVFAETTAKYSGYRLGLLENYIPVKIKKKLSLHSFFWNSKE